jgi:hypothetical protein
MTTNTKQDQIQTLLDTVERLRTAKYPELNATLVRDILLLHADAAATDNELSRAVEELAEQHVGAD